MARSPPSPRAKHGLRAGAQDRRDRAERLLALFTWHRDAPLVARSLGLSLDELHEQLDELKLRRKAYRLVRGSPFDLPIVKAVSGGRSGPPVRRRARAARPESVPDAGERTSSDEGAAPASPAAADATSGQRRANAIAEQRAQLVAVLAEVGPRRGALARRLGSRSQPLPERVLLARFRAAGLERELGQRERDLLRGLFARHRGNARAVAKDLGIDEETLRRLVRGRGLSAEIEALGKRFHDEGRRRRSPQQ